MKNPNNFAEYLVQKGLSDPSNEELEIARKRYRKTYHRDYKDSRKNQYHRVTIEFVLPEYRKLQDRCEMENLSTSQYVRDLVYADMNQYVFLPHARELQSIQGLCTQIYLELVTRSKNEKKRGIRNLLQELIKLFSDINQKIESLMSAPKDLIHRLKDHLEQNPVEQEKVQSLLKSLKS